MEWQSEYYASNGWTPRVYEMGRQGEGESTHHETLYPCETTSLAERHNVSTEPDASNGCRCHSAHGSPDEKQSRCSKLQSLGDAQKDATDKLTALCGHGMPEQVSSMSLYHSGTRSVQGGMGHLSWSRSPAGGHGGRIKLARATTAPRMGPADFAYRRVPGNFVWTQMSPLTRGTVDEISRAITAGAGTTAGPVSRQGHRHHIKPTRRQELLRTAESTTECCGAACPT